MPSLKAVSLSWTLSWAAVLLGEHEGQKTFPVSFGFHYFVPTQGRGAGKRPREAETGSLQRGGQAALPWTRLAEGEEVGSSAQPQPWPSQAPAPCPRQASLLAPSLHPRLSL